MRAEATFQIPAAITYYERAVRAEPTALEYRIALHDLLIDVEGPERAHLHLEGLTDSPPMRECFDEAAASNGAALRRLMSVPAQRECAAFFLNALNQQTPDAIEVMLRAVALRRAAPREILMLTDALQRAHRSADAIRVLDTAMQNVQSPRGRMQIGFALIRALSEAGQQQRAVETGALLAAAVQRTRLPGVTYWYMTERAGLLTGDAQFEELRQAAEVARRSGAYAYCAHQLSELVNHEIDNGQMRTALLDGPRGVACADRSGVDFQRGSTRVRYGRALAKSGDLRNAEKVLLEAWGYAQRSGPDYLRADVWHNLAHTYEAAGRWRAARAAVDRFVHLTQPFPGASQHIVALRDAGIIYWDSGSRGSARSYFARMVRIIQQYHHEHYWAGEYYERTGDLANARKYYRLAMLEDGDRARRSAGLTRVYLALHELDSAAVFARVHDAASQTPEEVLLTPAVEAARGNYAQALRSSRAWAAHQEAQKNVRGAANAQLQAADIAFALRDYPQAQRLATRAFELAASASLRAEQAQALVYLAAAQNARDAHTGVPMLTRAIAQARASGPQTVLADAFATLGEVQWRRGDAKAALSAFDSALAITKGTADKFESTFDRLRYSDPLSERIGQVAWRAARARDAAMLYQWNVRRKAHDRPLRSIAQVQARLAAHTALIDYLVTDSGAAALVITRNTQVVVPLPADRARLRALVNAFRTPIAVAFGSLDRTRSHFDYTSAAQLYDALILPLHSALGASTHWLIVPDDALHLVPFDAFANTHDGPARFVIEDAATAYLPSSDAAPAAGSVDLHDVTVVGTAAPGVQSELRAIRAVVPDARVLRDMPEAQLRPMLPRASVLHFAVHAEADARQPLSAYLQLTPSGAADGRYDVTEISADHFRADLVVLSACETLYGRVFAGGPLSLARAFTTSGARFVIATQWPVGESTAEFSRVLYQQLAAHVNPDDAVRAAQLSMLHNAHTSDPILWAPFQVLAGRRAALTSHSAN